ncbi:keratin-associated protein 26-1 [Cavia porcellus]|uniref:keratin-associated protein 26-1 n=1 Tax=Cavia porcellus TaxID=10141 RepID=UPI000184D616|nr:keratin-associated protein 26-1 [Cavia porcellus]
MSCRNSGTGNCSSGSPRSSYHVPLNPAVALCSPNVSCGDVLYLPGGCQGSTWFTDYCQGTCEELTSCQPATCGPSHGGAHFSTGHCVTRPCHGGSFLPASSLISSSGIPVTYKPLSYVSSTCRPLSPLVNTLQPAGCVSSSCHPLPYFASSGRPLSVLPYGCQPSTSLVYRPQTVHVVSSGLRPVQPISGGCRPLTHGVSPCHPPCAVQGGQ